MISLKLMDIVHGLHHISKVAKGRFDVWFDIFVDFQGLNLRISAMTAFNLTAILTKDMETVGQVEGLAATIDKRQKTSLTMNPVNVQLA